MSVLSKDLNDSTHVGVIIEAGSAHYEDLLECHRCWSQFEPPEDELVRDLSEGLGQKINKELVKRLFEAKVLDPF